jgi:hypothetical protein
MTDLYFDPILREIIFENGDFKLTEDPSIQNGMILKDATCANIYYPSLGVGVGVNLINSPIERTVNLMNIWATQCKQDGATKAIYKLNQNGNNIEIDIDVNYL